MLETLFSESEMNEVLTNSNEIRLFQEFDCYCYLERRPRKTKKFIIKSKIPMTRRYILFELYRKGFRLTCNHKFLESLDVYRDTIVWFNGS